MSTSWIIEGHDTTKKIIEYSYNYTWILNFVKSAAVPMAAMGENSWSMSINTRSAATC